MTMTKINTFDKFKFIKFVDGLSIYISIDSNVIKFKQKK